MWNATCKFQNYFVCALNRKQRSETSWCDSSYSTHVQIQLNRAGFKHFQGTAHTICCRLSSSTVSGNVTQFNTELLPAPTPSQHSFSLAAPALPYLLRAPRHIPCGAQPRAPDPRPCFTSLRAPSSPLHNNPTFPRNLSALPSALQNHGTTQSFFVLSPTPSAQHFWAQAAPSLASCLPVPHHLPSILLHSPYHGYSWQLSSSSPSNTNLLKQPQHPPKHPQHSSSYAPHYRLPTTVLSAPPGVRPPFCAPPSRRAPLKIIQSPPGCPLAPRYSLVPHNMGQTALQPPTVPLSPITVGLAVLQLPNTPLSPITGGSTCPTAPHYPLKPHKEGSRLPCSPPPHSLEP